MADERKAVRARRVLYVENGIGYGGAVICLRHLVRNLDRSRYEPIVVTGKGMPPYDQIGADARWLPIRDRLLDTLGWQRTVAESRFGRAFPRLSGLVRKLIGRIDDAVNFLPFLVRLVVVLARTRPALVHANNDPTCNRAALIAGKLMGIPVVCHVRGDYPRPTRMLAWLYSIPAHLIAVSHWIADGMEALGVSRERRSVIYDGIELDRLDAKANGQAFRDRYGIKRDEFAVGLIGLLIPWKGQRLFLEAGKALLERIPNLRLVMVGGTPPTWKQYERELHAESHDSLLRDRVVFTGHVPDMAPAYNGLDVVLSASTSPEPLGTVVIEALAMGRPLIVPAHGGGAEMVEHENTGLLFTPGDARALADAIHRLHADRNLREALSPAARAKAFRTFSVQQHVEQVQAVYDSVLASDRRPAHTLTAAEQTEPRGG